MRFFNARTWFGLCLCVLLGCGEEQDSKKDRDDDTTKITTTPTTSTTTSSRCKPLDSACRSEEAMEREAMMEGGMSMMDRDWDDDFEIVPISQGACGEALTLLNGCEKLPEGERIQSEDLYFYDLCVRQDYDFARCTITHIQAICESFPDDEPAAWLDCIDDARAARECDGLVVGAMSCGGMELHELPPELRKTGEACTEVDRTLGRCAMYHHDDLCQYAADRAQNPDVTYPARENSFYDCAFRQDD